MNTLIIIACILIAVAVALLIISAILQKRYSKLIEREDEYNRQRSINTVDLPYGNKSTKPLPKEYRETIDKERTLLSLYEKRNIQLKNLPGPWPNKHESITERREKELQEDEERKRQEDNDRNRISDVIGTELLMSDVSSLFESNNDTPSNDISNDVSADNSTLNFDGFDGGSGGGAGATDTW